MRFIGGCLFPIILLVLAVLSWVAGWIAEGHVVNNGLGMSAFIVIFIVFYVGACTLDGVYDKPKEYENSTSSEKARDE